jgi:hypothetical protein
MGRTPSAEMSHRLRLMVTVAFMRQMSGTVRRYQRTLVVIGSVAEADDVVQEVLRVYQILDAGAQITSPRVDVLTHCGPHADFTSLLKSARWLVPRKYLFEILQTIVCYYPRVIGDALSALAPTATRSAVWRSWTVRGTPRRV